MSTPISQFIPPLPPLVKISLYFYICDFISALQITYCTIFLDSTYDTIFIFSLSDLLYYVWQSLRPSMLLQVALFCSFLWAPFISAWHLMTSAEHTSGDVPLISWFLGNGRDVSSAPHRDEWAVPPLRKSSSVTRFHCSAGPLGSHHHCLIQSPQHPGKVSSINIPILQMRKLRFTEVKWPHSQ